MLFRIQFVSLRRERAQSRVRLQRSRQTLLGRSVAYEDLTSYPFKCMLHTGSLTRFMSACSGPVWTRRAYSRLPCQSFLSPCARSKSILKPYTQISRCPICVLASWTNGDDDLESSAQEARAHVAMRPTQTLALSVARLGTSLATCRDSVSPALFNVVYVVYPPNNSLRTASLGNFSRSQNRLRPGPAPAWRLHCEHAGKYKERDVQSHQSPSLQGISDELLYFGFSC